MPQINVTLSKKEMDKLDNIRKCRNPECSRYAFAKEAILDRLKREEAEKNEQGIHTEGRSGEAHQRAQTSLYGELAGIFESRGEAREIARELFRPEK